MSVIIIGTGGGRNALDRVFNTAHKMTPEQLARAQDLLAKFEQDIAVLCDEVFGDTTE